MAACYNKDVFDVGALYIMYKCKAFQISRYHHKTRRIIISPKEGGLCLSKVFLLCVHNKHICTAPSRRNFGSAHRLSAEVLDKLWTNCDEI